MTHSTVTNTSIWVTSRHSVTVLSNDPTAEMGPRDKRPASFKAQGLGPNKRTPNGYEDPYFDAGGADVHFVVHNIVDDKKRFGTPIYKVQWQQLVGRDHQKIEDTWEPLENIKGCDPRLVENHLLRQSQKIEAAALHASQKREQRIATAARANDAAIAQANSGSVASFLGGGNALALARPAPNGGTAQPQGNTVAAGKPHYVFLISSSSLQTFANDSSTSITFFYRL